MPIGIRPLHDSFGAEVFGVDIAHPLDAAAFAAIEDAWRRYSILLFRDVRMTPSEHIAFTRRLGPLHIMEPLEFNLAGHPEIFIVSNVEEGGKAVGLKRAGWGWHSDGEDKAIPNAGSFLYAHEVPPEGGDTLFADTYAAFAELPADVQRLITGRRACFSRVRLHHVHYPHMKPLTEAQKRDRPDVWHPIARRHPRSGWTALYIGRWACEIEGLPQQEATELIAFLLDFAHRSEFVYRHLMHRTTIEGDKPVMTDLPVFRPAPAVAAQ